MIHPVIVVMHAAFAEDRRAGYQRVMRDLRAHAPDIDVRPIIDETRAGCVATWHRAMRWGLAVAGATHVVLLPDDAIICQDFGRMLRAAIEARPDDAFDCQVNHTAFRHGYPPTCWYSTTDGYTGFGGVMPRDLLVEHLRWRESHPELADYPPDAGVNLWAAATRRLIYKTAWSLVLHDTSIGSLVGNEKQEAEGHERRGLRPVDEARTGVMSDAMNFLTRTFLSPDTGRAQSVTHMGRTYVGNVFDLVRLLPPPKWDLDAMYRACHPPNEAEMHVVILVPVYRETEETLRVTNPSREAVQADLEAAGVQCTIVHPPPESHVDRMRQRATHLALKMGATHILWWDADIECLNPWSVRTMLESGHDVIAGACPFKNATGDVVCNLMPETKALLARGEGRLDLKGGCIEVQDAGTGFMLVSRAALLAMFQAHPEMCHLSRGDGDRGEPLWAVWDASLAGADSETWAESLRSRVFLTEDFFFGALWQGMGNKVYVFAPARFRHWGMHGYEGSFERQYKLTGAM